MKDDYEFDDEELDVDEVMEERGARYAKELHAGTNKASVNEARQEANRGFRSGPQVFSLIL